VNLSQYSDEVVRWGSSEETFEMCPWIGPSGKLDPSLDFHANLGFYFRLGFYPWSDWGLGQIGPFARNVSSARILSLGRDLSLAQNDPRLRLDPLFGFHSRENWTLGRIYPRLGFTRLRILYLPLGFSRIPIFYPQPRIFSFCYFFKNINKTHF
jgi:hypothetical protein